MKNEFYQTIPELDIKGRFDTTKEFENIGMPRNMELQTVLDIGCNTGAFLIEAGKRGACDLYGLEPNPMWRLMAQGCYWEYYKYHLRPDEEFPDLIIFWDLDDLYSCGGAYDLVLLLSVLHLVKNPQEILDKAWELTGALLIVEINDRLQKIPIKLPKEATFYGFNKDHRSVYHCIKSYE
jgi:SAM-dependent methyltransferase